MSKKILILPSWYATPEAPTSGSFFREQAELMLPEFDVRVLVSDKRWISWRRYYFEKLVKHHERLLSDYFIQDPPTLHFEYDYIKRFSEEKNFEIQLENYEQVLEKLFKNNWRPDLLHAHSSFLGGIVASHLSEKYNIPYCITEHMNPFVLHNYSLFWRDKIVNALEHTNMVLAVSEHQKQHILMNGIRCSIITVGNLVNESLFSLNGEKDNESFVIFFVAYYPNFIKDIDTFFAALKLLKDENITAIVVGGGEISGTLGENIFARKADEYGVSDIVSIIPKASRKEMNDLYSKSKMLVSSSIAESFGVAPCEAMLCGLPVVTTNNGGCSEYMVEGENGHVVPLQNASELAKKILFVKENYSRYNSSSIRDIIVSRFGKKVFKERISSVYHQIIENV